MTLISNASEGTQNWWSGFFNQSGRVLKRNLLVIMELNDEFPSQYSSVYEYT